MLHPDNIFYYTFISDIPQIKKSASINRDTFKKFKLLEYSSIDIKEWEYW